MYIMIYEHSADEHGPDCLMAKDDLAKRSVWSFTSVFTMIIPLVIL